MTKSYSLPQAERINSKKQVERLFRGGVSKALSAFPLRMVYMVEEREECDGASPAAQMMVSVPKRYFKRAVKRNRVKRQVREAFRLNKHVLADTLDTIGGKAVSACFIWTDNNLRPQAEVEEKGLLVRLAERIQREAAKETEAAE